MNIPAALAISSELIPLVASSLLRLFDLNNTGLITLEFSELTNYVRFPQASLNVSELREIGVGVLFDDYLSVESPAGLYFIPEEIPFSGYKIDMRAVWLAQQDLDIRKKFERLVSFSNKRRIDCIAEGIETFSDVSLMASLGIR